MAFLTTKPHIEQPYNLILILLDGRMCHFCVSEYRKDGGDIHFRPYTYRLLNVTQAKSTVRCRYKYSQNSKWILAYWSFPNYCTVCNLSVLKR